MNKLTVALIIIGFIGCLVGFTLFLGGLWNISRTQVVIDEQRKLVQKTTEQANQWKEAQRLIREDETNQWRRSVDAINKVQDYNISNILQRLEGIDRQLVVGVPFHATGGVYPNQRYKIEVIAVDNVFPDGMPQSGRVIATFDSVPNAIEYLEGIK